jgi:hypothetical protein
VKKCEKGIADYYCFLNPDVTEIVYKSPE